MDAGGEIESRLQERTSRRKGLGGIGGQFRFGGDAERVEDELEAFRPSWLWSAGTVSRTVSQAGDSENMGCPVVSTSNSLMASTLIRVYDSGRVNEVMVLPK